jgi:hypothetical protein
MAAVRWAAAAAAWALSACGTEGALGAAHGVPRVNFGFASTSAQLNDFDAYFIECPFNPQYTCRAEWAASLSAASLQDTPYATAHPSSWTNYLQSLLVYAGVGAVLALLALVAGLVACCCGRFCCKEPVLKQYEDNGEILRPTEYPAWQTVGTYLCLVLFMVLTFTFTLLALVRGNLALTSAQASLVDAPDGLAELASNAFEPTVGLTVSLAGALQALAGRVNKTLVVTGNLSKVHADFVCTASLVGFAATSPLNATNATLAAVQATLNAAPTQAQVDAAVDSGSARLQGLAGALATAEVSVAALSRLLSTDVSVEAVEAEAAQVAANLTWARGNVTALKTALTSYVAIQGSVASTTAALNPLVGGATFNTAAVGLYTAALLNAFSSAYASTRSTLSGLPAEDGLKAQTVALAAALRPLDAALQALRSRVAAANASVAAAPSPTRLGTDVDGVVSALDALDLDQLQSNLTGLTGFLKTLPPLKPLNDTVDALIALNATVVPCVLRLAEYPLALSQSLVALPPAVLALSAQLRTLVGALDGLKSAKTQLAQVDALNGGASSLTDRFAQVLADAKAAKARARNDALALKAQLAARPGGGSAPLIDLAPALAAIDNARVALSSPQLSNPPPAATLGAFDALKTARATLSANLDSIDASMKPKVQALALAAPASQSCPPALGGQTCYALAGAGSFSECGTAGSFFCPYPFNEFKLTYLQLAGFSAAISSSSPGPSLTGEVLPAINQLDAAAAAVDVSGLADLSALKQIRALAAAADAQIDAARAQTLVAKAQLDSMKGNFTNILAQKSTFQAVVSSLRASVDTADAFLSGRDGRLAQVEVVLAFEARLHKLVFETGAAILARLSAPALRAQLDAGGVRGAALYLAGVLDQLAAAVDPSAGALVAAQLAGNPSLYLSVVDAVRDRAQELRKEGSVYYLARVAGEAMRSANTAARVVLLNTSAVAQYAQPLATGHLLDDGSVQPYAGGALCLTDACLKATVRYYNALPMNKLGTGLPLPPISREASMALPFIIPAVLFVIAAFIFFKPECGYALTCCSCCVGPFLFIVFGGLLFPAVMLTADTCATVELAAVVNARGLSPSLCRSITEGAVVTTGGICAYEIQYTDPALTAPDSGIVTPATSVRVELDLPNILRSLLLNCDAASTANVPGGAAAREPIEALFQYFAGRAEIFARAVLDRLLLETLPQALNITLRQPLVDDVYAGLPELGADLRQLAEGLGGSVGCAPVHKAVAGIKDSLCGSFGEVFYWSVAGWYLIAWTLLLMGIPLGIVAATRLRNLAVAREQMRLFTKQVMSPRHNGAGADLGGVPIAAEVVDHDSVRLEPRSASDANAPAPSLKDRFRRLGSAFKGKLARVNVRNAPADKGSRDGNVELNTLSDSTSSAGGPRQLALAPQQEHVKALEPEQDPLQAMPAVGPETTGEARISVPKLAAPRVSTASAPRTGTQDDGEARISITKSRPSSTGSATSASGSATSASGSARARPASSTASARARPASSSAARPLSFSADPGLAKYVKMKKAGAQVSSIENAAEQDGVALPAGFFDGYVAPAFEEHFS